MWIWLVDVGCLPPTEFSQALHETFAAWAEDEAQIGSAPPEPPPPAPKDAGFNPFATLLKDVKVKR